jgi:hypothetical protein
MTGRASAAPRRTTKEPCMTRRTRSLAALAALALLGIAAPGCGSDAATNTGGDGGASSGGNTARAKGVKFAQCMRDHGVDHFPDPDASGDLTADGVANDASVDTNSPAWDAASSACRDLQPAGFTGHRRSAAQQKAALAFAQCVRESGVSDFPDPGPGDPLIDTNRIPSAAGKGARDIPGFDAATHKCGAIYAGQLGLTLP